MLAELRRDSPLSRAILRFQPWSIDFHQRMKLFREIVDAERISIQGSDDVNLGQRSDLFSIISHFKVVLEV